MAVPAVTAVTTPCAETVATAGFPLLHATGRPVSGVPLASAAEAVSDWEAPTSRLRLLGVMATEATGTADTVMLAAASFPSTVAVIMATPGATAVTTPCADTEAMAGRSLLQSTGRPVSRPPFAS